MLLRLVLAVFLVENASFDGARSDVFWEWVVAAIAGAGLALGLWTPICAIAAAVLELWLVWNAGEPLAAHGLAFGIAGALAVLGPGAWSLDARLFGRRRISVDDR